VQKDRTKEAIFATPLSKALASRLNKGAFFHLLVKNKAAFFRQL